MMSDTRAVCHGGDCLSFQNMVRQSTSELGPPLDVGFQVKVRAWNLHQAVGRQCQVLADGNCWWRSLSTLIAGDQSHWRETKRYVKEKVATNSKMRGAFGSRSRLRRVLRQFGHKNRWATSVEVALAAWALGKSIKIYTPANTWQFEPDMCNDQIEIVLEKQHFTPLLADMHHHMGSRDDWSQWFRVGGKCATPHPVQPHARLAGDIGDTVDELYKPNPFLMQTQEHFQGTGEGDVVKTEGELDIKMQYENLRGGGKKASRTLQRMRPDAEDIFLGNGPDTVIVSILRENYSWRQAFAQRAIGFRFHVPRDTTQTQIADALERRLHLRRDKIVLKDDTGHLISPTTCVGDGAVWVLSTASQSRPPRREAGPSTPQLGAKPKCRARSLASRAAEPSILEQQDGPEVAQS